MKKIIYLIIILILAPSVLLADQKIDSDNDGLTDEMEINIYHTDPSNPDTDADSYPDGEEVKNNYSPLTAEKIKLDKTDFDKDGLSDSMEIAFKTDLTKPDTDNDGHTDGQEVKNGFDPVKGKNAKLLKSLQISLKQQELSYFLGPVKLGEFPISSGLHNSTPVGEFKITNKSPRAWSKLAGLWMPYWLGIKNQKFGLHELPEWPNGAKEGADHLGKPASHGCIRLGVGAAKTIYNWAEINTPVIIKK